jgi:hypothetical protein
MFDYWNEKLVPPYLSIKNGSAPPTPNASFQMGTGAISQE